MEADRKLRGVVNDHSEVTGALRNNYVGEQLFHPVLSEKGKKGSSRRQNLSTNLVKVMRDTISSPYQEAPGHVIGGRYSPPKSMHIPRILKQKQAVEMKKEQQKASSMSNNSLNKRAIQSPEGIQACNLLHNHLIRRNNILNTQYAWFSSLKSKYQISNAQKNDAEKEILHRLGFDSMRLRIETMWDELRVPKQDCSYYTSKFMEKTSENNFAAMKEHLEILVQHWNRVQLVLQLIQFRENEIQLFEQLIQDVDKKNLEMDHKIFLQHTIIGRQATLAVIQAIMQWRKDFWRPKPFLWRSCNYLLKILSDTSFLTTSAAAQEILEDLGMNQSNLFVLGEIVEQQHEFSPRVAMDQSNSLLCDLEMIHSVNNLSTFFEEMEKLREADSITLIHQLKKPTSAWARDLCTSTQVLLSEEAVQRDNRLEELSLTRK